MYLEYKCIHCHTCVNVCPPSKPSPSTRTRFST
ncbi:4Fe-4S binding protein [Thermococcus sp. JCM 11816]